MLGISALGFLCYVIEQPGAVFVAMPLLAATVWGFHGLFFHAVAAANPLAPARASSIASVGVLIGAVAGPLAFGAIAELSYRVAWGCASGWAMVGMAAIVWARRLLQEETGIDGRVMVALAVSQPPRRIE